MCSQLELSQSHCRSFYYSHVNVSLLAHTVDCRISESPFHGIARSKWIDHRGDLRAISRIFGITQAD
jgi:hypothetical protein